MTNIRYVQVLNSTDLYLILMKPKITNTVRYMILLGATLSISEANKVFVINNVNGVHVEDLDTGVKKNEKRNKTHFNEGKQQWEKTGSFLKVPRLLFGVQCLQSCLW